PTRTVASPGGVGISATAAATSSLTRAATAFPSRIVAVMGADGSRSATASAPSPPRGDLRLGAFCHRFGGHLATGSVGGRRRGGGGSLRRVLDRLGDLPFPRLEPAFDPGAHRGDPSAADGDYRRSDDDRQDGVEEPDDDGGSD